MLAAPACLAAGGALALLGAGVLGAVGLGTAGLVWPGLARLRPVALASYVVMVNAACAVATWNAVRGHRVARWDTERPGASSTSSSTEATS